MTTLTDKQHRNFWRKVRVNPETGCHEWTAGVNPQGYGMFRATGQMRLAHRIAYSLYHEPPPADRYVCHTCDNPRCVRRDHLFLGTPQDNASDMVRKGRQSQGALRVATMRQHAARKFTDADIARVHALEAQGWLQAWIARELGMSQAHVSLLVNGARRVGG